MNVDGADHLRRQVITVSLAGQEELEVVLEILEDAARWTTARGFGGWRPGSFSVATFREQIRREEVFLARIGAKVVGTITLQLSDDTHWADESKDAVYVHKLAVMRDSSGRGIGIQLLKWAETQARLVDKKYLRLNCLAEDTRLRQYYEFLGFELRGEVMEPRGRNVLYEKRLSCEA